MRVFSECGLGKLRVREGHKKLYLYIFQSLIMHVNNYYIMHNQCPEIEIIDEYVVNIYLFIFYIVR